MASTIDQANLYELSGEDTSITYTPLGFGGSSQLNYRRAGRISSFEAARFVRPLPRSVRS